MYIIAQIVGILAVVSFLLSYQFKKRKHIIFVNALSSGLYVLQYILLGALEGAAIDILSAVATVVASNKDKSFILKRLKLVVILLNLSFLVAGLMLYKNIFSLFPIMGAMMQTGAFWLSEEKKIRRMSFFGAPFWLVYNAVSKAYGSALGSILCMISIGLAIYRYDIAPKRKHNVKNAKEHVR